MADTAIALTSITASGGVYQSGLISTGGTAVDTGNTGVIAAVGNTRQLIVTGFGTAASTLTFEAGDEPPSENAGLGSSGALTVALNGPYFFLLDAGRFVQSDGTVRALVGGTGPVEVTAYIDPRNT